MEQGSENNLEDVDLAVRNQSYSAMAPDIQVLDDLIHHINQGLSQLSGHDHDRGLNLLTAILLNRAHNSLWRAREDAVLGYAAESLTLCRTALEHWTAARWVELHPDKRDCWLWAIVEEVERPEHWPPTTNKMLKELGELGSTPLEMYGVLSKFAHPKSVGLRWMIHYDPESTHFHAGGHFDERGLRVCLYFLIGTAQACLEPVARLQARMLGAPGSEWLDEGNRISDPAGSFLRSTEAEIMSEAAKLPEISDSDLAD